MSMTTQLIDKLRHMANDIEQKHLRKILHEAADTIELLSIKLHTSQMERSAAYYNGGWIPGDYPPQDDDSYIVEWVPKSRPVNCRTSHYYAIFNYYEDEGWDVDVPEPFEKSEVEILAWRHLPQEYKED